MYVAHLIKVKGEIEGVRSVWGGEKVERRRGEHLPESSVYENPRRKPAVWMLKPKYYIEHDGSWL